MEKALGILELLEAVLLHVDMKTLLISAIRVNKTWNQLINTSPQLQKLLYFQPMTQNAASRLPPVPLSLDIGPDSPRLNPLLLQTFGRYFFDFSETYGFWRTATALYALPWTSSAAKEMVRPGNDEKAPEYRILVPTDMPRLEVRRERHCRRHFTRAGASWRRMLVTQPPPPSFGFVSTEEFEALWETRIVDRFQQGMIAPGTNMITNDYLTMGNLYDMVQYFASHHKLISIRIHWYQPARGFVTRSHEDAIRSQLKETWVAIEMFKPKQEYRDLWAQTPDHKLDPSDFEDVFRCDESLVSRSLVRKIISSETVLRHKHTANSWSRDVYSVDRYVNALKEGFVERT